MALLRQEKSGKESVAKSAEMTKAEAEIKRHASPASFPALPALPALPPPAAVRGAQRAKF